MTNHSLGAILEILRLEPAHCPVRMELERIALRARLNQADTEVGGPLLRENDPQDRSGEPEPAHRTRRCHGVDVIFE